ncbi:MAG: Flp family type IVb pilin [Chloroflexota bacterium]
MFILAFLIRLRLWCSAWSTTLFSVDEESGQGLVEYALIIILVGVVVIALLAAMGPTISNLFTNILESVEDVNP